MVGKTKSGTVLRERWISEKLDGIRAYWDGEKLFSRNGKNILAPIWFMQTLPELPVDGELWMGRGTRENLCGVLNSSPSNPLWKSVDYVLFDLPCSEQPYSLRMDALRKLRLRPPVRILDTEKCQGNEHLLKKLKEIVNEGGEGLMANEPESLYIKGQRSGNLLKVKV